MRRRGRGQKVAIRVGIYFSLCIACRESRYGATVATVNQAKCTNMCHWQDRNSIFDLKLSKRISNPRREVIFALKLQGIYCTEVVGSTRVWRLKYVIACKPGWFEISLLFSYLTILSDTQSDSLSSHEAVRKTCHIFATYCVVWKNWGVIHMRC